MEPTQSAEARERILDASIRLFSEKGFDATRVNEIADDVRVNKALIYYYFKSKEDILDQLVRSVIQQVGSIALDFIRESIVQMIGDGRLDIEPDRMRFRDRAAVEAYLSSSRRYYERALDYVLKHRVVIRILMLESLKRGKHHNSLFQFLEFLRPAEDNLVYATITNDMMMSKFFFGIVPLINFAAYYDDYREMNTLSDQALRDSFLLCCEQLGIIFCLRDGYNAAGRQHREVSHLVSGRFRRAGDRSEAILFGRY